MCCFLFVFFPQSAGGLGLPVNSGNLRKRWNSIGGFSGASGPPHGIRSCEKIHQFDRNILSFAEMFPRIFRTERED